MQPWSETVEVKGVDEYDEEEICSDDDDSVNSGTRSIKRCSQQTITNTTRFNIGHENGKKYGYHRDIRMQMFDAIKYTFLETKDIKPTTDEYWDS